MHSRAPFPLVVLFILLLLTNLAPAADPPRLTREQVLAKFHPYTGPSEKGVDVSTLTGKIMCGYQGWFGAPGDGFGGGFRHWAKGRNFEPGSANIDLWPDVSELDPDERYDTGFKHKDGSVAQVFSSVNPKTVNRHFQWMKQYGIDGVFVQRFIVDTGSPNGLDRVNTVLDHCRESANKNGRAYAVMYDLSGLGQNSINTVIEDWKQLIDHMKITSDPAYLHHNGKPVVTVWGIGFNDRRKYTLDESIQLIKFLKDDPTYGHNTVMIGVPTYWRTLDRDALKDPKLLECAALADIISPWTVGRFGTPDQAANYARKVVAPDIAWCKEHKKDFLPVAFPGFSWHNMNPRSKSNQIPRLGGEFLWTQYAEYQKAGATMIYQAMFDEVDEGTAIFKVTSDPPPAGDSTFVTLEGLPPDHYLKLVGQGTKMLCKEIPWTATLPK
jgi:hypothetical protein